MIRGIFPLLAILCSTTSIAAQTATSDNVIALANEPVDGVVPFIERLSDAAKISGAVFAGMQVRQTAESAVGLKVYLPPSWQGKLICSRVVSADGLYESVNTYRVAPAPGADADAPLLAPVPFETRYGDKLAKLPEDELAIRVSLGACASGQTEEVTVAYWNAGVAPRISLLVNSFRASRVFVYVGEEARPPIQCAPVEVSARTAYDTLCLLEDLPAQQDIKLGVFRVRENGTTSLDEIHIQTPHTE